MFEKKSDFHIPVVDHMTDEDLNEINFNFPIIFVDVGIWNNVTW